MSSTGDIVYPLPWPQGNSGYELSPRTLHFEIRDRPGGGGKGPDDAIINMYSGIRTLAYDEVNKVDIPYANPADLYDKHTYVLLGKNYNNTLILDTDFRNLLTGNLRGYWRQFKRWSGSSTISILPNWSLDGSYHTMFPDVILATPEDDEAQAAWEKRQNAAFTKVLRSVATAKLDKGYNVMARFIQPAVKSLPDAFSVVLTPNENPTDVTEDNLKAYVAQLGSDKMPYKYEVTSWAKAEARKLKYLSGSFLPYYHTWIDADKYDEACNAVGTKATYTRPWPDATTAEALDVALYEGSAREKGNESLSVRLTLLKLQAAKGKVRSPDQKAVMGDSATVAASKLGWGTVGVLSKGSPKAAEWLHRSAFRFGGIVDTAQYNTSQDRKNLVFGSGDANTHMIRPENHISQVIEAYKPSIAAAPTLVTGIKNSGTVDRFDTELDATSTTIDAWVKAKEYKWLALEMSYQVTYNDSSKNVNYNAVVDIDPFSRYCPFRFEGALDELIFKDIFAAKSSSLSSSASGSGKLKNMMVAQSHSATAILATNPALDPSRMQIWQAATSSAESVTADGVTFLNPSVLQPPSSSLEATTRLRAGIAVPSTGPGGTPASAPPPEGFTLVGDINLFGIAGLTAKLYSWKGPLPPGIVPGPLEPVYDRAIVDGDFQLSSVLAKLKGSPFDKIPFQNTTFTYQNYVFDPTKALGWHVDADVVIDESCGDLHELLRTALGVQEPTIHLHAGLGSTQSWSSSLILSSFTLDGTFVGISAKICDELTITSIGVQLMGIRTVERTPSPQEVMKYGFGVFGTMNITVPGSIVPLELQYQMSELNGSVSLCADLSGDIWSDALGIKGLVLSSVAFSAGVDISAPMKTFSFNVAASFDHGSTSAYLDGSYAAGGGFALSATLADFTMTNVFDLFEAITGGALDYPTTDVTVGMATLSIASGAGLAVSLQNVQVSDFVAAEGQLSISSTGASIRADITSSDTLSFGDVDLKKAFIQLDFQTTSSGKDTDVLLGGQVTISSLTIDAAVHLYEDPTGPQWTVYAGLTSAGQSMPLSKLVPELANTFLDMALSEVAFCAASKDDPSLEAFLSSPAPYTYHQGVQFCATFGNIGVMNQLLRAPASGFLLSAGWSKTKGFTLDITAPNPTVVHLGRGITTDPFTLQIQFGGEDPSLLLYAGVKVPTPNSSVPLDFKLALDIDPVGAKASAEMDGYWVDPFGISNNVKIGPNVILDIEIVFAQFFSTGIPSGLGLAGGMQIGKAIANFAVEISDDPMHELLSAEVQNLDVDDVVSFANVVTGLSIPQPVNFVTFKDLKVYICPEPTTLGTVTYPQGFSFDADMILFGKEAEIDCNVTSTGATIHGSVDNFKLGPLEVKGANGPKAIVDIEIGVAKQQILVNGVATFFDTEDALNVNVEVLPTPTFIFQTTLKFTDLLLFTLTAQLVGSISFTEIDDVDFSFDALLEQHILQYVSQELGKQLDLAKTATDQGIEDATEKVNEVKQTVDAAIAAAQAQLDTAQKAYQQKADEVQKTAGAYIADYTDKITVLQEQFYDAKAKYVVAAGAVQSKLQAAQNDRSAKMAAAQSAVDSAQKTMNDSIAGAQAAVADAEGKMQRDFGSAEADIASCQSKVNSLQSQIDDVQNQINYYNGLPWYDPRHAAAAGLYPELGALQASKASADAALSAAQDVLKGAAYAADEAAIQGAEASLQAATTVAQGPFIAAKATLSAVDTSTAAAVSAAQQVVDAFGQSVEAVAFQAANAALQGFITASAAALSAARAAIAALANSAEALALRAAQEGLQAAQHATVGLDAAEAALKAAEASANAALAVAKWAAEHGDDLVDIQTIHLYGSLRSSMGENGNVDKALSVQVQGSALGRGFTFEGTFDPRKTADFITSIFTELWDYIK